jgi:hypothetical protein
MDISKPALLSDRLPFRSDGLTPETQVLQEAGISMDFLNGRLAVEGSLFNNRSSNAYVPVVDELSARVINGGTHRVMGWEVELKGTPLSGAVSWTPSVNFTRTRSRVERLPEGMRRIALAGFEEISPSLVVGQPYGVLYGTRYLRDVNGERVIGEDGFPLVDPEMGVIGNPNPDWTMGLNNQLTFKNFSFEMLVEVKRGGDVWNGSRNTMNYFGTGGATSDERQITNYVFSGVKINGEPNSTPVDFANPANGLEGNRWIRYGRAGVAEDGIEDASWVRLRNVAVSYNFKESVLRSLRMKKLSMTFSANNLLLITKYSGIDPDTNLTGYTNARGIDYFNLPNTKSYGLLIKAGF